MKVILKILFFIFWLKTSLLSQELKIVQDKKNYYYYEHPTLSHRALTELRDKIYAIQYHCLLVDKVLSPISYDIHNKIVDHLSEHIESDDITRFNTIDLNFYLNTSTLQIDHLVISTSDDKSISPEKEEIFIRLLNEAYKIDFKSLLDLDFNVCPHFKSHEWIMWRIAFIMNNKLYYIRL